MRPSQEKACAGRAGRDGDVGLVASSRPAMRSRTPLGYPYQPSTIAAHRPMTAAMLRRRWEEGWLRRGDTWRGAYRLPGRMMRTACDLPSLRCSISKETSSPTRGRTPSCGNAEICTNTSPALPAGSTKPNPRLSFHFVNVPWVRTIGTPLRRGSPLSGVTGCSTLHVETVKRRQSQA